MTRRTPGKKLSVVPVLDFFLEAFECGLVNLDLRPAILRL